MCANFLTVINTSFLFLFLQKELRMLMPLESEASFENFMKRRKHGKKNGARRGRGGDDSDESDE